MTATRAVPTSTQPAGGFHRPTIWAAAGAVMIAQMCLTVLAPLNATIQAQFGASAGQLTWLAAAVFAPTAILELSFGVLGDLFGRKRLMIIGLSFVITGSLLATLAWSLPALAVALVLQGLGAAVLLPSTLASAAEFSPAPADRATALSRWALAISLGAALSPLLAGVMAQTRGLHAAFLPILIGSVLALIGVIRWARDSRSPQRRSLDWPGQILIMVGLLAFIFAVIHGAEAGFDRPVVIAALLVALVALPLFVVVELRSANPMFQVRLLKIPAFTAAAAAGLLGMLGFLGTAYAMAIKLGPIAQAAPLTVALPFVLIQLVPLAVARWLPRLLQRVSPRILLVAGLVTLAVGQVWLAALPDQTTALLPMAPPILLLGVGFIVMFTSLTAAAINSVSHDQIGMASGATSLVRETGQTLGAAVVAAIALGKASSLLSADLASSGLPAEGLAAAEQVLSAGGPLALATAALPESVRSVVAPLAINALERGFDLGLLAMAGCSLLAALIVLVVMRRPAR